MRLLHHPAAQPVLHRVLVALGERLPFRLAELLHVLGADLLGGRVAGARHSGWNRRRAPCTGTEDEVKRKSELDTDEQDLIQHRCSSFSAAGPARASPIIYLLCLT